MAGIISTTWVNGRYVQSNVNLEAILERNTPREPVQPLARAPPKFGLLTQTVVESPVFHWILPARLGNVQDYDMAFIGDNIVELRRLTQQNRLVDVGRITGIDSRIRNARTIDLLPADQQREDGEVDLIMTGKNLVPQLGPQALVLALESGDLAFLFAPDEGPGSRISAPVVYRHKVSRTLLSDQPGKHLTVDPSSRYLALSASENLFVVFGLRSEAILNAQYASGNSVCPLDGEGRYFHLEGVIQKMEFLVPSANDPDHVILLLLVGRNNSTRMHVFEWVAGQQLSEIRSNNKKGHIVPDIYRMPLLLIPLAFQSAFILVCEHGMAVCKSLLEGTPDTIAIHVGVDPPTDIHSGLGPPLWTSWTRPDRHKEWARSHDDIYIAREDGLVKFLEIDCEEFVQAQMNAGNFTCTIGSAFASLVSRGSEIQELCDPKLGPFGDLLITSGDSCTGGMYLVRAREAARFISPVPNWSPMTDFVSVNIDHNAAYNRNSRMAPVQHPIPERIFACTGRGVNGAVTEIQAGVEAELWLDIAEFDFPINDVWVLPTDPTCKYESRTYSSSVFLLSSSKNSSLLQLEGFGDVSGITGVNQESTWLDLTTRTIAAAGNNDTVVQITEKGISISSGPLVFDINNRIPKVSHKFWATDAVVIAGAIYENLFALIVHQNRDGDVRAVLLGLPAATTIRDFTANDEEQESSQIKALIEFRPPGQYPTFVSLVRISDEATYAVFGSGESPSNMAVETAENRRIVSAVHLLKLNLDGSIANQNPSSVNWELGNASFNDIPETCVSVLFLPGNDADENKSSLLLAGFRSGLLVMFHYRVTSNNDFDLISQVSRPIGSTPVIITKDSNHSHAALICCDSKLHRLVFDSRSSANPLLTRIWIVGGLGGVLLQQPPVDRISAFLRASLVISGKQLLAVRLGFNLENHAIPRHMVVRGSPTRVLFSNYLHALVIAIYFGDSPDLKIVEPETGCSLATAYSRDPRKGGKAVKFASGLRRSGDKILCLIEWNWKDGDEEHRFLVVGTSSGRLLLVKAELQNVTQAVQSTDNIHYWTSFKQRYAGAVSAILAVNDQLFCCIGDTVQLMTLDVGGTTIKTIAEQRLPSRGVSITVEKQLLNVLTARDSLVSFRLKDGKLHPDHLDVVARASLDQLCSTVQGEGEEEEYLLSLVSDKDCSVVGLLDHKDGFVALPHEFTTAFEAELPVCVTKFRRTKTRPAWDSNRNHPLARGVVPFGASDVDILGIGIDGSIRSFTVLQESLWQLLKFIQDLARRSPTIFPVSFERARLPEKRMEQKRRHIDGDVLRRCTVPNSLEKLLGVGQEEMQDDQRNDSAMEFQRLVSHWSANDTMATPGNIALCISEVYQLLDELLRPVL